MPTTVQLLQKAIAEMLVHIVSIQEARQMAKMLLMHHLGLTSTGLVLNADRLVDDHTLEVVEQQVGRLLNHEPIQYILGTAHFYGLDFAVNSSVLIPRPETEELVDWIVKENSLVNPAILDIGTGSGCIATTLKHQMPQAHVEGWDISSDALAVATLNASSIGVEVAFRQVDILSCEPSPANHFDIIVSNPPYVRELEKQQMSHNVLDHEPHLALFVSNSDPLLFYRTIAQKAKVMLKPGGLLYFEINEYLGGEMLEMLEKLGYDAILKQDLQGKDRMIRAWQVH